MIRADVEDGNLRPNLVPVPEAFGPAEEAQVKRLICVTGFGAGDSRGRRGFLYSAAFHLLLGRVYDDKDVQERIVRGSKLDWVIVRPVILTNGPKTNAYRALVDPRGWTCGFISHADYLGLHLCSRR
jgi:NAD(P)H-binding